MSKCYCVIYKTVKKQTGQYIFQALTYNPYCVIKHCGSEFEILYSLNTCIHKKSTVVQLISCLEINLILTTHPMPLQLLVYFCIIVFRKGRTGLGCRRSSLGCRRSGLGTLQNTFTGLINNMQSTLSQWWPSTVLGTVVLQ